MSRQREKYVVGDTGASGRRAAGAAALQRLPVRVRTVGVEDVGCSLEGGGEERRMRGELCRRGCGQRRPSRIGRKLAAVSECGSRCVGARWLLCSGGAQDNGRRGDEAAPWMAGAQRVHREGRWDHAGCKGAVSNCDKRVGKALGMSDVVEVFWQQWMVMLVAVEWGETGGKHAAYRRWCGRRVVVEDVNGSVVGWIDEFINTMPGDAEERKGGRRQERKERIKGRGTNKHSTPIRNARTRGREKLKKIDISASPEAKKRSAGHVRRGAWTGSTETRSAATREHGAKGNMACVGEEKSCVHGADEGTVVVMVVRQAPRGADGVDGNVLVLSRCTETNASRHDASVGDERDTGTGKVVWSEDDLEWKKLDTRVAGSGWKLQGGRTFNYKPKLTVSVQKKVWRNGGGNPGIEISFSATEIIDFNLNFSSG
ncbi:hypothetical protein B0H13DRAFT_1890900 [Mycena leptocephala]|nr:hypothetical protein B0H13DRAFT_1890900 [Mycena leptocephala]